MTDAYSTVSAMNNWDAYGISIPKPVADKLEIWNRLRDYQPAKPDADTADLTTKNIDQTIWDLATEHAAHDHTSKVAAALRSRTEVNIVHEMNKHAGSLLDQLQAGFDQAVDEFKQAMAKLPDPLSDQALVRSGPEAVAAYQDAMDAANVIGNAARFAAQLGLLPMFAGDPIDPVLFIAKPKDESELRKIWNAEGRLTQAERELGGTLVSAVRHGIELRLSTPAQAREQLQVIESLR